MFSCPTFSEFRFYGCCHPLQLFFSYAIDVIIRFYVHLASVPLAYKLERDNGVHWICNTLTDFFFILFSFKSKSRDPGFNTYNKGGIILLSGGWLHAPNFTRGGKTPSARFCRGSCIITKTAWKRQESRIKASLKMKNNPFLRFLFTDKNLLFYFIFLVLKILK